MDIDERIERRRRRDESPRLIQDSESLSPVAYIEEPSDRGPVLERLLDHLDPVFDGRLPSNAYVHGPVGSGKTAVVTALFSHFTDLSTRTQSVIYTSTRAESTSAPEFVYVDVRATTSEFAFYHTILDALLGESVPEHGIGTADIRDRLHDGLRASREGVVVGLDHVDASDGIDGGDLVDLLAALPSSVSWLAIGREAPEDVELTEYTARTIHVDAYQRQVLVDVLMTRASAGLSQRALDHGLARRIADWADGNAHDALTALFVATDHANAAQRQQLTEPDVTAALSEVPQPSVPMGRVLALPNNKQLVLRALVDLEDEDRASVAATTDAISGAPDLDLSRGTVKRYLYEMAETGVIERVQAAACAGKGRPPSRVELRFSPTAFRRLYDRQQ